MCIHPRAYTRARERALAYRGLVTRGAPLRLHPRYRPTLVFRPTLTRSPRWPCVSDGNEKIKKTQERNAKAPESWSVYAIPEGFARVDRAWHARSCTRTSRLARMNACIGKFAHRLILAPSPFILHSSRGPRFRNPHSRIYA